MKKALNKKMFAAVLALVIAMAALCGCGNTQATIVQRQNNNSNRGTNIHSGF